MQPKSLGDNADVHAMATRWGAAAGMPPIR